MFTRHFVALVLISATTSACPEAPTFVTTDDGTSEAATGPTPTTTAASSTGDSSTGDSDASSSSTTAAPTTTTGTEAVDCGAPADECTPMNREWCVDLGDLCGKTPLSPAPGEGAGTDYCAIVDSMCEAGTPPCQLCNYAANTCKQLGGGDALCDAALAECLCHAQAHDLPI